MPDAGLGLGLASQLEQTRLSSVASIRLRSKKIARCLLRQTRMSRAVNSNGLARASSTLGATRAGSSTWMTIQGSEPTQSGTAKVDVARKWHKTIDRITPSLTTQPKLLIPDIKGNDDSFTYDPGTLYP